MSRYIPADPINPRVASYRIKPDEHYILSNEKGRGPKAQAFFTAKNVERRGFLLT